MKKFFLITSFLLSASTFASSADDATAQLASDLNATAPSYQSQTVSSVSIAPRDNLIIATTITRWDPKASDSLSIHWIAPRGSYCQSSTFPITRGPNSNHDVFWAYRTVVHTNRSGATVTCDGHWVAEVVNTNTGQVLASAGYDVVPLNKPPLTGDTTLPADTSASELPLPTADNSGQ